MVLSQKIRQISPLARAVGVIGVVMALVTSITYAAFVDSATLTGNTITTATANADLLLWDGDSFEETAPGFAFNALEPDVESDRKPFYFKNDGNVPLYVTVTIPETVVDFGGVDPTKVTFNFYGECAGAEVTPVSATMAALMAGEVDMPCEPLAADAQGVIGEEGNEANFEVSVTLAADVVLPETEDPSEPFSLLFNGYTEDADTGGEVPEVPEP